ncbi:MAG: OsmC family protein [Mycobacteriales bacterium]
MGAARTSRLTVSHIEGDRFSIAVRDHVLTVDQPVDQGGGDTAPTPTELFVASLASCVAHYARRYLSRHDLPTAGLTVTAEHELGSRPARVTEVRLLLTVPDGVPPERHAPLLAVASHCTVHNTLESPPDVQVELRAPVTRSTS